MEVQQYETFCLCMFYLSRDMKNSHRSKATLIGMSNSFPIASSNFKYIFIALEKQSHTPSVCALCVHTT